MAVGATVFVAGNVVGFGSGVFVAETFVAVGGDYVAGGTFTKIVAGWVTDTCEGRLPMVEQLESVNNATLLNNNFAEVILILRIFHI